MYTLTQFLSFAAAGALAFSVASIPTRADEMAQNLGPVGVHEPILTTVGGKRVIAFYEPGGGNCDLHVIAWNQNDASGDLVARVRVSLNPRQMVHIDSAENKSINLQCGDNAETLALADTSKFVAAGVAQ